MTTCLTLRATLRHIANYYVDSSLSVTTNVSTTNQNVHEISKNFSISTNSERGTKFLKISKLHAVLRVRMKNSSKRSGVGGGGMERLVEGGSRACQLHETILHSMNPRVNGSRW